MKFNIQWRRVSDGKMGLLCFGPQKIVPLDYDQATATRLANSFNVDGKKHGLEYQAVPVDKSAKESNGIPSQTSS